MAKLKHFYLKRIRDLSGSSGVGNVAIGVIFPNKQAVLQWQTIHKSICIYDTIEDVEKIHGHNGATKVIIGDPSDSTKRKRRTSKNSK